MADDLPAWALDEAAGLLADRYGVFDFARRERIARALVAARIEGATMVREAAETAVDEAPCYDSLRENDPIVERVQRRCAAAIHALDPAEVASRGKE